MNSYLIDCSTCQADPKACADCVMAFIADPEYAGPVRFSEAERQALAVMADVGLLPRLRLVA